MNTRKYQTQIDIGDYKVKAQPSPIVSLLFIGLMIAAIAPLSVSVFNIPIFTPYVPFFVLIIVILVRGKFNKRGSLRRREEYVFISVQILILMFTFLSGNPGESLRQSFYVIYVAALYWASRYIFNQRLINYRWLFRSIVAIFFGLAILAITQFITKVNYGVIPAYFGENLTQGVAIDNITDSVRVSGTFANSNVFAAVYGLYGGLIVAFLLVFGKSTAFFKAIIVSSTVIIVTAMSLSRSGLINASVILLLLYSYWAAQGGRQRGQRIAVYLIMTCLALVLALTVISFVEPRTLMGFERLTFFDSEDVSISSRTETYLAALEILTVPSILAFGVGSGQVFEAFSAHGIFISWKAYLDPSVRTGSVHNWVLQIATEHGVAVLFLYTYAIYLMVGRGWQIRRTVAGQRVGQMAGAVALIVSCIFLITFQLTVLGKTVWLLTPVVILFAWIQFVYDVTLHRLRREVGSYQVDNGKRVV